MALYDYKVVLTPKQGEIQDQTTATVSTMTLSEDNQYLIYPHPDKEKFPKSSKIMRFELYDDPGKKNKPVWTWERNTPTLDPAELLAIYKASKGGIILNNINFCVDPTPKFYFSIIVLDDTGKSHLIDPELKIPKRTHPIIPFEKESKECPK